MERRPPSARRALTTILAKDLRVELRTLESVPAMAIFAVTAFVLFRFALDTARLRGGLATGVLVMTLLLAALLAINRIFVAEREEHGFDAILLAPIERTALLGAKVVALWLYQLVLAAIVVPVFALFFLDARPAAVPAIALALALATGGIAVVGTLVASMAVHGRAREVLTPLLTLPLLVPLVIATAGALSPLLAEGAPDFEGVGGWLTVLGLYDVLVSLIAWALFDFVVED